MAITRSHTATSTPVPQQVPLPGTPPVPANPAVAPQAPTAVVPQATQPAGPQAPQAVPPAAPQNAQPVGPRPRPRAGSAPGTLPGRLQIGPIPQIPAYRPGPRAPQIPQIPQAPPAPIAPPQAQPADPTAQALAALGQTFGTALATALGQIRPSAPAEATKYPKAKDPSLFNGKKRRHLRTWLGENEICFRTAPNLYRNGASKVMFAGSFLEGDAKTWFTDYFKDPYNTPLFMEDWDLFGDELQRTFGLNDELGAAEEDLRHLTMSDRDRATFFTGRFRAITSNLLGLWSDRTLRNAYLSKLPPRLVSQFESAGKRIPDSLDNLIEAVEDFDSAHWAGVETRRAQGVQPPAPEITRDRRPQAQAPARPPTRAPAIPTPGRPAPVGRPVLAHTPVRSPAFNNHLKNGKLTDAERKRRIDAGACLYCGELGHLVADCAKRITLGAGSADPATSALLVGDVQDPKPLVRSSYTVNPNGSSDSGKD
jgi:hypothetical protein